MLFSLEGCDRAGKTTLYNALRVRYARQDIRFVPNVPFDNRLMPVVDIVQERTVALWDALYDKRAIYIADRVPFVSNIVYAKVYGRAVPSYPTWHDELRVVYLRAPAEVLATRPHEEPPTNLAEAVAAYDEIVKSYHSLTIDATKPLIEQVSDFEVYSTGAIYARNLRCSREVVGRKA